MFLQKSWTDRQNTGSKEDILHCQAIVGYPTGLEGECEWKDIQSSKICNFSASDSVMCWFQNISDVHWVPSVCERNTVFLIEISEMFYETQSSL